MSGSTVSAQDLFSVIASKDSSNESKLHHIQQLKSHVKKDLVDITQVAKYVEALAIAVDIPDLGISTVSFSVLSHLVKRVSMQDKSGSVLKGQSFLILPIIINRLGDSKASTRSSARKALEAYWFSAPKQVEEAVAEIALKHRNSSINLESILWLDHIIMNVNQHFKLDPFLPALASALASNSSSSNGDLVISIKTLFSDYYNLRQNRLYKFDLAKELENHRVSLDLINDIMKDVTGINEEVSLPALVRGNINISHSTPPNPRLSKQSPSPMILSTKSQKLASPVESEPLPIIVHSSQETQEDEPTTDSEAETDPKLRSIIAKSKYAIDTSIPPLEVTDARTLNDIVEDVLSVFTGKETEFNWTSREKHIVKLRSLLRGNAPKEYRDELLLNIKEAAESINKAVATLRTTLSSHGCHLVKECAIIFQSDFDPLVDSFLPSLMKLCSATKLIASTNANHTIIAILVSCSYNHRNLQKIQSCAHEKNVQPRTYSGLWIQILLLRFSTNQSFLSAHMTTGSGVEVTCKILQKLLADPNPGARQVGKDTFWCFWSKFPGEAEALLTKLEPNIVKNLERSRPQAVAGNSRLPSTVPKKPRSSIKESIIQRNKELKSKQREVAVQSRPASRNTPELYPSSNSHQQNETKHSRFQRLGIPKRSFSNSSNHPRAASRSATPTEISHSKVRSTSARMDSKNDPAKDENTKTSISVEDPKPRAKSIEKNSESAMVFDKHTDPILKFLSSNQNGLIEEGVNLLKYAILGNEDLSTEIPGLLRMISIRDPHLLAPLFLSGDNILKRSFPFFTSEDFLRVCCILIDSSVEEKVELIVSLINADQIYDAVTKLLSYTISTSNILDDDELTIQIIRFKSSIIKMAVSSLLKSLDKIPISDSNFSKLSANLLDLVSLLKSTEVYSIFSSLMIKLHTINAILFTSELDLVDESTREEVDLILGTDRNLTKTMPKINNLGSLFDLTQVNHRGDIDKFSPVKLSTDFTMIMPIRKENNDLTYIPKVEPLRPESNIRVDEEVLNLESQTISAEESKKKLSNVAKASAEIKHEILEDLQERSKETASLEADLMEIDSDLKDTCNVAEQTHSKDKLNGEHSSPMNTPHSPARIEEKNVFVESNSEGRKSNLFSKMGSSSDQSIELVDDFAQVTLTGELDQRDPVQKFIERMDPLKSISNKNKQINIFEDGQGSPQKVRDYNYSESNWFNFQLAKNSVESFVEQLEDVPIQKFKEVCDAIYSNQVSKADFIAASNYIQNLDSCDLEFHKYFETEGKTRLENSIWCFFQNCQDSTQPIVLNGVILLKQLLLSRCELKLQTLWNTLVELNKFSFISGELIHATEETFEELLSGLYGSSEIFTYVLQSLNDVEITKNHRVLIFIMGSLSKFLKTSMNFTDSELDLVDQALFKYMNNEAVEVRRCVIINYSIMLKCSRVSGNQANSHNDKNVMDQIFSKLTFTQQKLVEFYSQE